MNIKGQLLYWNQINPKQSARKRCHSGIPQRLLISLQEINKVLAKLWKFNRRASSTRRALRNSEIPEIMDRAQYQWISGLKSLRLWLERGIAQPEIDKTKVNTPYYKRSYEADELVPMGEVELHTLLDEYYGEDTRQLKRKCSEKLAPKEDAQIKRQHRGSPSRVPDQDDGSIDDTVSEQDQSICLSFDPGFSWTHSTDSGCNQTSHPARAETVITSATSTGYPSSPCSSCLKYPNNRECDEQIHYAEPSPRTETGENTALKKTTEVSDVE